MPSPSGSSRRLPASARMDRRTPAHRYSITETGRASARWLSAPRSRALRVQALLKVFFGESSVDDMRASGRSGRRPSRSSTGTGSPTATTPARATTASVRAQRLVARLLGEQQAATVRWAEWAERRHRVGAPLPGGCRVGHRRDRSTGEPFDPDPLLSWAGPRFGAEPPATLARSSKRPSAMPCRGRCRGGRLRRARHDGDTGVVRDPSSTNDDQRRRRRRQARRAIDWCRSSSTTPATAAATDSTIDRATRARGASGSRSAASRTSSSIRVGARNRSARTSKTGASGASAARSSRSRAVTPHSEAHRSSNQNPVTFLR